MTPSVKEVSLTMTNRRSLIISGLLLPATFSLAHARPEGRLELHVTYTGAGQVDENHKVHVAVWDNPEFQRMNAGPPLAGQSVDSKQGTVEFTGLKTSRVYVTVGYDPVGEWDGSGPPTLNVWIGMYAAQDGKPRPIELPPGKLAKIRVTLDNSFRRPPDANGK